MESIFNIFSTPEDTVKLQKPISSAGLFLGKAGAGPLKQRAKSDSSNVYGKKVLGDIRNTLQQTNKTDSKENVPVKGKSEDCANAVCSGTPLLPKLQGIHKMVHKTQEKQTLKKQTPVPKKLLEVPKTVHKLGGLKMRENSVSKSGTPSSKTSSNISSVFQEIVFNSPELQGQDPGTKDVDLFDVPCKCCEVGVPSNDCVEETSEPEIQGPAPIIEDSEVDIWPITERPTLEDYKRIMFWDSSKQLAESEYSVPELIEDGVVHFDYDPILPPVGDFDIGVSTVPKLEPEE